jgi:RHS repeat-associated protein
MRHDYDDLGRLTGVSTQEEFPLGTGTFPVTIQDEAFDYNESGNLWHRHDWNHRYNQTFAYDQLDRLKTWSADTTNKVWSTTFGYDDLGNRKSVTETVNGATTRDETFYFDPNHPHQFSGSSLGASFGYDSRGNEEFAPGRSTTFNRFNLPSHAVGAGNTIDYRYDPDRQRTVATGSTLTRVSIGGLFERSIDQNGQVGVVIRVYSGDRLIAEVRQDESQASSMPRDMVFVADSAMGSVGLLVSATSSPTSLEYRFYDPFGGPVDIGESGTSLGQDIVSGFTGQDHDFGLGLINMVGRIYDPKYGKFLSADPFVFTPFESTGYNRYAYALHNPNRWVDPTGFEGEESSSPSEGSRKNDGAGNDDGTGPVGAPCAGPDADPSCAHVNDSDWWASRDRSDDRPLPADNGLWSDSRQSSSDWSGNQWRSAGTAASCDDQSCSGGGGSQNQSGNFPLPGGGSVSGDRVFAALDCGRCGVTPLERYPDESGFHYILRQVFGGPGAAVPTPIAGVSMAAAKTVTTTLFRAVTEAELGSITKSGGFSLLEGQAGKYFTLSLEEASRYAALAARTEGMLGTDFFIVQTTLRSSLLEGIGMQGIEGGIRSAFVPAHLIPQLTRPTILNIGASGL